MTKAKDLRAVGERIDELLEEFAVVADPRMMPSPRTSPMVALVALGYVLAKNLPDIIRYIKITRMANVGVAQYLFERDSFWLLSAIAGVVVGAVWNYAVTAVYTWKAR